MTPLAWKNLTHDRRRLAAATGGVTFAVVLMFTQAGFWHALLDGAARVLELLDADLVLVSSAQYALPAAERFPRQRLAQARACPGVASAAPLYVEPFLGVLRAPGKTGHPIRVLAHEPGQPALRLPRAEALGQVLARPDTALFDQRSKAAAYGVDIGGLGPDAPRAVELAGKTIQLRGAFSLGADFANDGNLLMSTQTFARCFPHRAPGDDPLGQIDLGLVKLTPEGDLARTRQLLAKRLPDDVAVFTVPELVEEEKKFWRNNTPIGYIFGVGAAMGFVVGVVICHQIIFTSINDHLREFATLRAMGYSQGYFIGVVFCTSFYLSLLGFAPGLALAQVVFSILEHTTGLLMYLNFERVATVYLYTLAMCVVSGALAIRKVLAADPAELFG